MKINGTLIGKLTAHTEDSRALLNRTLHIYATKTTLKVYLFNSSCIGWYRDCNVIYNATIKFYSIKKVVITEVINNIMQKFNLEFSGYFQFEDENYKYVNGEQVFEVDCGYWTKDKFGIVTYHGEQTDNGMVYKNLKAWELCNGVIYIGEYQLNDLNNGEVDPNHLWTRDTWFNWVKDYIKSMYNENEEFENIIKCDEFIESLALDCLENADWQDLSTLLNDYEYNEDWVMTNWEDWKNK